MSHRAGAPWGWIEVVGPGTPLSLPWGLSPPNPPRPPATSLSYAIRLGELEVRSPWATRPYVRE